jgi:hypothetical protein
MERVLVLDLRVLITKLGRKITTKFSAKRTARRKKNSSLAVDNADDMRYTKENNARLCQSCD